LHCRHDQGPSWSKSDRFGPGSWTRDAPPDGEVTRLEWAKTLATQALSRL